jgi:cobalamin synthase
MKRSNLPLFIIIGVLGLLFVAPFVILLVSTVLSGEYYWPAELTQALEQEINVNLLVAILLTVLPMGLVALVETSRRSNNRQVGDRRARSTRLTLGLLVGLMLALTMVPFFTVGGRLNALPLRATAPLYLFIALPFFAVLVTVLIASLGGFSRWRDGVGGEQESGDPPPGGVDQAA